MGKKVNPLTFRLGIYQNHRSNWFSNFKDYSKILKQDRQIRLLLIWFLKFIEENEKNKLFNFHDINIERFSNNNKLLIEIKILQKIDIKDLFNKYYEKCSNIFYEIKKLSFIQQIYIRLVNINKYLIDATFILDLLTSKVSKKVTFRRAIQTVLYEFRSLTNQLKKTNTSIKDFGLIIKISGRINGVDLAHVTKVNEGTISLQKLTSNISYKSERLETPFGTIGIKIWVSNNFKNN